MFYLSPSAIQEPISFGTFGRAPAACWQRGHGCGGREHGCGGKEVNNNRQKQSSKQQSSKQQSFKNNLPNKNRPQESSTRIICKVPHTSYQHAQGRSTWEEAASSSLLGEMVGVVGVVGGVAAAAGLLWLWLWLWWLVRWLLRWFRLGRRTIAAVPMAVRMQQSLTMVQVSRYPKTLEHLSAFAWPRISNLIIIHQHRKSFNNAIRLYIS